MRVLFVIHELALNGAVIALLQQVRLLHERGHAVAVLCPALDGPAAALLPRFEAVGAHIRATMTPAEHDVAVGCTVFAADTLHALMGHLPLVWWIHEGMAGVRHVLAQPKAAAVLGAADKLIFPSRPVAERLFAPLLGATPPGRVEVIPGIVSAPSPAAPAAKPAGTFRVLCVGSVYPRKRQADVVQAVALLRGAVVECVLAGDFYRLEPPGPSIIEGAPERFRLTGGLAPELVASLYRSADVFSLPSEDESMPLAPVEAAWHGIPVVLSDLDCYAGVWRDGHNALIHPVGDVEMLAWHLRALFESPSLRARLVANGRATAARFSAHRAGPAFEATLVEAITAWRGARGETAQPDARIVRPAETTKLAPAQWDNLTELADRYGSDKGTLRGTPPHRYAFLYDLLFFGLREQPITVLEIGLAIGGPELGGPVERRVSSPSVAMWLDYFPRARIVGFDISDFSHLAHPRFTFVRGDAGSTEDLARLAATAPGFDVIIDDGSHASYHQQLALRTLFPKLAPGGLYIIEDLHWQSPFYEGALPAVPRTADFLEQLLLHGTYVENPLLPREAAEDIRNRLASFALFPDFAGGQEAPRSEIKMIVLRARRDGEARSASMG